MRRRELIAGIIAATLAVPTISHAGSIQFDASRFRAIVTSILNEDTPSHMAIFDNERRLHAVLCLASDNHTIRHWMTYRGPDGRANAIETYVLRERPFKLTIVRRGYEVDIAEKQQYCGLCTPLNHLIEEYRRVAV